MTTFWDRAHHRHGAPIPRYKMPEDNILAVNPVKVCWVEYEGGFSSNRARLEFEPELFNSSKLEIELEFVNSYQAPAQAQAYSYSSLAQLVCGLCTPSPRLAPP
ncbi:unnamed protein product [Cuscuta europaea]|uniref:Uncharacterized protein n=1 Tax=Cuscuta europaea TaxID=41803 RepID=A0A9P0YZ69_CUSEU|nr:unnamed protein product [Cuscuta europaea]